MIKEKRLKYIVFCLLNMTGIFAFVGQVAAQAIVGDTHSGYSVAAYVWPSCHDDRPKGHELLWPAGTGEWEIIKKGTPRFEGHYQPKQPLWGYEMDNNPQVMENGLMQLRNME